jgi:hypothetical protein
VILPMGAKTKRTAGHAITHKKEYTDAALFWLRQNDLRRGLHRRFDLLAFRLRRRRRDFT